jgi:uncharacterized protein (DUF488 family)
VQKELRLPSASLKVQMQNKESWNDARREKGTADFFTIGYSGRTIDQFLKALGEASVSCLIDVRANPVSMYKPDFSKSNLIRHLLSVGIQYLHLPNLGVPRDIRSKATQEGGRSNIWGWYDEHVVQHFCGGNLHRFMNLGDHPVAFMCTELDPTECHRHRLSLALEKGGLNGLDI